MQKQDNIRQLILVDFLNCLVLMFVLVCVFRVIYNVVMLKWKENHTITVIVSSNVTPAPIKS